MIFSETLNAIVSDTWESFDPTLRVRLLHDHDKDQYVVSVMDRRPDGKVTWKYIDTAELIRNDAQHAVSYLDRQVQDVVGMHRWPYRDYPHSEAADEMEYLT